MFKRLLAGILLCGCLFLAACGSEEEVNDEPDYETKITADYDNAAYVRELTKYQLEGIWQTDPDENGTWIEADVADDVIILREAAYADLYERATTNMSILADDSEVITLEIIWIGTFSSPHWADDNAIRDYHWESVRDFTSAVEFTETDDTIMFWYSNEVLSCHIDTDTGISADLDFRKIYDEDDAQDALMRELMTAPAAEPEELSVQEDQGDEYGSRDPAADSVPAADVQPVTVECDHDFRSVTTREATCVSEGTVTHTCSKCGYSYTDTIPKTSHNYTTMTIRSATCGEDGEEQLTCSVCGSSYTRTIPATGDHQWVDITETVTTQEQGHNEVSTDYITVYTCSECGFESKTTAEMDAHIKKVHDGGSSYTSRKSTEQKTTWVVDVPAQTETIVTGQRCSVCGAVQ